ncbi:MAG: hypothetical protein M3539_11980 [Acidobacteriota bacterium]|nr:hypothetical protein [Acidobacteriota bacterium]
MPRSFINYNRSLLFQGGDTGATPTLGTNLVNNSKLPNHTTDILSVVPPHFDAIIEK